jgi:hypothetical protein
MCVRVAQSMGVEIEDVRLWAFRYHIDKENEYIHLLHSSLTPNPPSLWQTYETQLWPGISHFIHILIRSERIGVRVIPLCIWDGHQMLLVTDNCASSLQIEMLVKKLCVCMMTDENTTENYEEKGREGN